MSEGARGVTPSQTELDSLISNLGNFEKLKKPGKTVWIEGEGPNRVIMSGTEWQKNHTTLRKVLYAVTLGIYYLFSPNTLGKLSTATLALQKTEATDEIQKKALSTLLFAVCKTKGELDEAEAQTVLNSAKNVPNTVLDIAKETFKQTHESTLDFSSVVDGLFNKLRGITTSAPPKAKKTDETAQKTLQKTDVDKERDKDKDAVPLSPLPSVSKGDVASTEEQAKDKEAEQKPAPEREGEPPVPPPLGDFTFISSGLATPIDGSKEDLATALKSKIKETNKEEPPEAPPTGPTPEQIAAAAAKAKEEEALQKDRDVQEFHGKKDALSKAGVVTGFPTLIDQKQLDGWFVRMEAAFEQKPAAERKKILENLGKFIPRLEEYQQRLGAAAQVGSEAMGKRYERIKDDDVQVAQTQKQASSKPAMSTTPMQKLLAEFPDISLEGVKRIDPDGMGLHSELVFPIPTLSLEDLEKYAKEEGWKEVLTSAQAKIPKYRQIPENLKTIEARVTENLRADLDAARAKYESMQSMHNDARAKYDAAKAKHEAADVEAAKETDETGKKKDDKRVEKENELLKKARQEESETGAILSYFDAIEQQYLSLQTAVQGLLKNREFLSAKTLDELGKADAKLDDFVAALQKQMKGKIEAFGNECEYVKTPEDLKLFGKKQQLQKDVSDKLRELKENILEAKKHNITYGSKRADELEKAFNALQGKTFEAQAKELEGIKNELNQLSKNVEAAAPLIRALRDTSSLSGKISERLKAAEKSDIFDAAVQQMVREGKLRGYPPPDAKNPTTLQEVVQMVQLLNEDPQLANVSAEKLASEEWRKTIERFLSTTRTLMLDSLALLEVTDLRKAIESEQIPADSKKGQLKQFFREIILKEFSIPQKVESSAEFASLSKKWAEKGMQYKALLANFDKIPAAADPVVDNLTKLLLPKEGTVEAYKEFLKIDDLNAILAILSKVQQAVAIKDEAAHLKQLRERDTPTIAFQRIKKILDQAKTPKAKGVEKTEKPFDFEIYKKERIEELSGMLHTLAELGSKKDNVAKIFEFIFFGKEAEDVQKYEKLKDMFLLQNVTDEKTLNERIKLLQDFLDKGIDLLNDFLVIDEKSRTIKSRPTVSEQDKAAQLVQVEKDKKSRLSDLLRSQIGPLEKLKSAADAKAGLSAFQVVAPQAKKVEADEWDDEVTVTPEKTATELEAERLEQERVQAEAAKKAKEEMAALRPQILKDFENTKKNLHSKLEKLQQATDAAAEKVKAEQEEAVRIKAEQERLAAERAKTEAAEKAQAKQKTIDTLRETLKAAYKGQGLPAKVPNEITPIEVFLESRKENLEKMIEKFAQSAAIQPSEDLQKSVRQFADVPVWLASYEGRFVGAQRDLNRYEKAIQDGTLPGTRRQTESAATDLKKARLELDKVTDYIKSLGTASKFSAKDTQLPQLLDIYNKTQPVVNLRKLESSKEEAERVSKKAERLAQERATEEAETQTQPQVKVVHEPEPTGTVAQSEADRLAQEQAKVEAEREAQLKAEEAQRQAEVAKMSDAEAADRKALEEQAKAQASQTSAQTVTTPQVETESATVQSKLAEQLEVQTEASKQVPQSEKVVEVVTEQQQVEVEKSDAEKLAEAQAQALKEKEVQQQAQASALGGDQVEVLPQVGDETGKPAPVVSEEPKPIPEGAPSVQTEVIDAGQEQTATLSPVSVETQQAEQVQKKPEERLEDAGSVEVTAKKEAAKPEAPVSAAKAEPKEFDEALIALNDEFTKLENALKETRTPGEEGEKEVMLEKIKAILLGGSSPKTKWKGNDVLEAAWKKQSFNLLKGQGEDKWKHQYKRIQTFIKGLLATGEPKMKKWKQYIETSSFGADLKSTIPAPNPLKKIFKPQKKA